MALKGRTSRTVLNLSLLALDISLFLHLNLSSTLGKVGHTPRVVNSASFSETVEIAEGRTLSGVYVENALALPVVQQPEGNATYVSARNGEITQFSTVSQYGNIGLLAHNYLSGKSFLELTVGQEVRLVFDDGQTEYFIVSEILRYQALEPNSTYSSFKNLDNKNEVLSAGEMFNRVYVGDHHITFQTCIHANGNSSWGRLFIVATPKPKYLSVGDLNSRGLP